MKQKELKVHFLADRVPVLILPPIPKEMSNNLMEWFQEALSTFHSLEEIMQSAFLERTSRLRKMPRKARDIFWWPFTQHKLVPEENVTVIDSRCGENFAVHKVVNVASSYENASVFYHLSSSFLTVLLEIYAVGTRNSCSITL